MIRQVLVIVIGLSFMNITAQDVTNAYIKNVQFRWHDIVYNTSSCNDGESDAEYKLRPYVLDNAYTNYGDFHNNSSEDANGLYPCPPYEIQDGNGAWQALNIHINESNIPPFYNVTNTNYTYLNAEYDIYFVGWESDGCGPSWEYNNNCSNDDDCPIGHLWDYNNGVVRFGADYLDYNGVWYNESLIAYYGSNDLYNRIEVDYKYSISSNKGTLSDKFQFGTLDPNGCFAEKQHRFNTDDDGRSANDDIFYSFSLNNMKSLRIEWGTNTFSSQPGSSFMLLTTTTAGVVEDVTGTYYKDYYNLPNGNYTIKLTLPTDLNGVGQHGRYVLKLSQLNNTSPSISHYWTGSSSNNWFEPCNWSTNHVPGNDNNVIIPLTSSDPRIYSSGNVSPDNANGYAAGKAYCNSVDIESGAKIIIESSPVGTAEFKVNHP